MIIRQHQILSMQKAREGEYIEALARQLENEFPSELTDQGLASGALRNALREAIGVARGHNIETDADLKSYAECVAILGPGFDRDPGNPAVGEILNRADLTGTEKMDAISELLLFGPGGPR